MLRLLTQKEELGLLDPGAYADEPPTAVDLDTPRQRATARRLAQESLVLLANDGVLPLVRPGADGAPAAPRRVAVVGPDADSAEALMGCYSFVNHVLAHHPGTPAGIELPTVLESLRDALAGAGTDVTYVRGCAVEGDDVTEIPAAVDAARDADVAVVVVGTRPGCSGAAPSARATTSSRSSCRACSGGSSRRSSRRARRSCSCCSPAAPTRSAGRSTRRRRAAACRPPSCRASSPARRAGAPSRTCSSAR